VFPVRYGMDLFILFRRHADVDVMYRYDSDK
jgi:hypothetical protein